MTSMASSEPWPSMGGEKNAGQDPRGRSTPRSYCIVVVVVVAVVVVVVVVVVVAVVAAAAGIVVVG